MVEQAVDAGLVVVAAGLIGFERESRRRPAGLKTHIVVGLSAWILVQVGVGVTHTYAAADGTRTDPIRIIQAIVYGISFIGAGTIFRHGRDDVRGLTTAASLLATTAIAISIGFGQRALAGAVTLMILTVLLVIGALERRLTETDRDD